MATIEGHDSSASSALTNTVDVPETPQAGDRIVVVAQALYTGSGIPSMTIQSDPGFTQHVAVNGDRIRRGWSKDWESGDPSSLTIEITAGFGGTPSVKFQFAAVWLMRPASSSSISFKAQGSPAGVGDSTLTTTATFNGGDPVTVESGDIITVGHLEDDRDVVYSSFDHDTFSLTINSTFNEGSGGPANWTGAGFASGVTDASSTDVSATNDASGNDYSMVALAFEEITPSPESPGEPGEFVGWGIPVGV